MVKHLCRNQMRLAWAIRIRMITWTERWAGWVVATYSTQRSLYNFSDRC
jgi:hypothetical protein